jgi:hypothetical protein
MSRKRHKFRDKTLHQQQNVPKTPQIPGQNPATAQKNPGRKFPPGLEQKDDVTFYQILILSCGAIHIASPSLMPNAS